ncbi:MAG: AAA family ATPase [Spirochaetes bacterium]|nr:AAA family ATPase [Spirochaetota bacterium]
MKLSKINIYGFKSFADKVSLLFDKQIIALVGPNGCGKSNIVDAILWMFQKSGLKILRAREKQDLIFKGSDTRSQAGFAEVELIFSNDSGIELEEYKIKKRLYQSGEFEVYINNRQVTIKELEKFYLQNGITSSDYSIIAQGNVETIISSKPEEKRAIIEEAANIKKNRQERDEAINKLKKTNENLVQIDLLLNEIKNELDRLYTQAEKAKKFKEYKNILSDSEKKLFIKKYFTTLRELKDLEDEYNNFEKKNNELKEKIEYLEAISKEKKDQIENIGKKIISQRELVIKIDGEITTAENTIGFYRSIIDDLQNQLNNKINNLKIYQSKKTELEELILMDIEDEEGNIESLKLRLDEYELKISDINSEISAKTSEMEKLKEEEKSIENQINEYSKKERDIVTQQVEDINKIIYKLELNFKNEKNFFKNEFDKLNLIKIKLKNKLQFFQDIKNLNKNISGDLITKTIEELNNIYISLEELFNTLDNHYYLFNEGENLLFSDSSSFKKREEIIEILNDLNKKHEGIKKNIKNYDEELKNITKLKEMFLIEKSNIQIKLSTIMERVKNIRNQREKYKKEIIEINYQIENTNSEISNLNNKLQESKEKVLQTIKNREKLLEEKNSIDKNIKQMETEIDKLSNELLFLQKQFNELFEEKRKFNDTINSFVSSKAKLETQLETLRTIFFENYREDISILNYEDFSIESEATLRKNIKDAQIKLEEIGEVNLLAIDEYEEVKKRYDFLTEQKNDILKSIEDIQKVISKLNDELSKTFLKTFDEVNKNFKMIFKNVFGGGEASLILTNPENILETGVDIKIQPPGKKVNYLNLLSGGEKTMSAISLLFALFLYRPSPFCIMDEVDAALDEINVERFKKLLIEFSKDTQFIIISHNKITLEIADILYGITMEESGVSKVVSAKLEKIK